MIKANKFEEITNNKKESKFDKMVKWQEKIIKGNMEQGLRSVLWIFSDKEQYTNDLEKQWFNEFDERAKTLFKRQGFVINGILIKW